MDITLTSKYNYYQSSIFNNFAMALFGSPTPTPPLQLGSYTLENRIITQEPQPQAL